MGPEFGYSSEVTICKVLHLPLIPANKITCPPSAKAADAACSTGTRDRVFPLIYLLGGWHLRHQQVSRQVAKLSRTDAPGSGALLTVTARWDTLPCR
jgi:hypothetical protein